MTQNIFGFLTIFNVREPNMKKALQSIKRFAGPKKSSQMSEFVARNGKEGARDCASWDWVYGLSSE
jgi:hypothetical protein